MPCNLVQCSAVQRGREREADEGTGIRKREDERRKLERKERYWKQERKLERKERCWKQERKEECHERREAEEVSKANKR